MRTQARVEKALAAAEKLVIDIGPEAISIPEVAMASGVPRASLYQFFANKYELLSMLTERFLIQVSDLLKEGGHALAGSEWRQAVRTMLESMQTYYNETPVASILLLGWPSSRETYHAQEVSLAVCGNEVHEIFQRLSPPLRIAPDVCILIVEVAFACFKHGYYRDGHISTATVEQCLLVTIGHIEQLQKVSQLT